MPNYIKKYQVFTIIMDCLERLDCLEQPIELPIELQNKIFADALKSMDFRIKVGFIHKLKCDEFAKSLSETLLKSKVSYYYSKNILGLGYICRSFIDNKYYMVYLRPGKYDEAEIHHL